MPQKWLVEEKSQCPHCRAPLLASQLVHCRFMDDLASQLHSLVFASPSSTQDVCPSHAAPMYYYCHTCNEGLCSDCAVIETKHKEHSIEHLHAVYKQHRARIDERAKKLYALFNDYSGLLAALNEQTAAIASTKLSMLEGYKTIWHEAVEHIERQEAIKLSVLSECKQLVSSEFDMLKRTLETLESQLSSAWQTDVIASSDEIIDLVDKLKPKSVEDFKVPLPTPDFESDIVPNYDRGTFRIRGFKALQQLSTPVYSEPIWASGLTWRLKVYCSGNGACRHECMSVFVELVSGTPVASKYQYRVELVNLSGSGPMRQRHISREFTSEFAVGECWGYNRFYSLDLLEQDGFYDPVEDAVELVYYVRAPTYAQRCRDLSYHISQLKKDSADVKLKTQKGSATPSGKSTARAGVPASPAAAAAAEQIGALAATAGPSSASAGTGEQRQASDLPEERPRTPVQAGSGNQMRSPNATPPASQLSSVAVPGAASASGTPGRAPRQRSSSTGGREETIVESIMNEQPALVDSTFDSTFDSIDLADVARAVGRQQILPRPRSSSQNAGAGSRTETNANVLDAAVSSATAAVASLRADAQGSQAIARSEEYLSSFDKFQQEMPDFESFVDTVAREVEIFESIVRKHPGTGSGGESGAGPSATGSASGVHHPSPQPSPTRPARQQPHRRTLSLSMPPLSPLAATAARSEGSSRRSAGARLEQRLADLNEQLAATTPELGSELQGAPRAADPPAVAAAAALLRAGVPSAATRGSASQYALLAASSSTSNADARAAAASSESADDLTRTTAGSARERTDDRAARFASALGALSSMPRLKSKGSARQNVTSASPGSAAVSPRTTQAGSASATTRPWQPDRSLSDRVSSLLRSSRRYGDCDDDDEEDNDENNDMDASGFDDELDLSDARHDLLRRGASGARPISGTLVDDDDADDDDLAGQHSAADDDDSILVASYRDVGGAGGSGGNGDIDAARVDAWMTGSTSMSIDADQSIDLLNVSIGDAELDAWLMRTLSPLNRMRQMRGAQRVLGSGGLGQTDRRRQSHADADTSDELGLAEWGTLSGAPRGPGLLRHLGQLERDRAAAEASLRRFFAADDSRDDGRDNGRSTPGTDMIRGTSDGESDRGEGVDGADDGHDDEDDEPDLDDEDDGQVGRGGHDDDGEDDEDDDDVVSRRRPSWLVGRIRDGLGSRAGDDDEGDDSGDGDDDDDAVGARSPSMRRDLLSDSSRLANDTTLVGTRGQRLAHVHSSVSASPGSRSAASSRGNGLAPQQRSMQDSISTLWM
ncbi:hypothetical protein HK105_204538 [Polyrhizophydium stewartii]|uniref:B box-type domain-containing protein n=1 Tax=Polyrhizophydium stewartii TaxID=2732419 RepID=A0ABR4N8L0_9FUNG